MADSGAMYKTFNSDFAANMARLCKKADIIIPNITEAAILCGCEYREPVHSREYIESLLHSLSDYPAKAVVLTGVSFDGGSIGCAVLDKSSGDISYVFSKKLPGMRGRSIAESADIATRFTFSAIKRTYIAGTDPRFGVNFEEGLGAYINMLGE